MTVFDAKADRPSEFDDSSQASLWDTPSRLPDSAVEARRAPRPRRRSGGSWLVGLAVVAAVAGVGLWFLQGLLR